MTTAKKVRPATTVVLDTGFGEGLYLRGTAEKDGSLSVATDKRLYQITCETVKVIGNQGEVGTATIEGSGFAINTEDEQGNPIPDLAVAVKIGLVNQALTLNVTETTSTSESKLPEVKATSNPAVGNPVRYI